MHATTMNIGKVISKAPEIFPHSMPVNILPRLAVIPRDTLIIVYCSNSECPLGRSLAEFLGVMEFKNLLLYDDGWDGWQKAGMPVDTTVAGDPQ